LNRGEKMYKGLEIGLSEGLVVTLFSMGVVFTALIVISYSVDLMKNLVSKK
jgi:Na+-transporting methylmalonyl-CoA/oxaloacetate decarboxylase gamma subunit